ncbi:MAG: nitrogenase [Firmicutes bacterium]|nr:nitrogenase [Bacillota bacterium]
MEKEIIYSRNVNENPCNMCMAMGGIIPFKGIEESMVIIHGSQGCSTYMRRHIAEHFNEPIDVGSSSLNEKGTIYGGGDNLKKAIDNIIKVYNPAIIGVLTTCLAETIGEDIDGIASEYLKEKELNNLPIITVSTPGYGNTHAEGYWAAVKRIVTNLAIKKEKGSKVNIIIPQLSPADIREIKRLLQLMEVQYTLLPDFSDTLDRPFERSYKKITKDGTKIKDIVEMPDAVATIQMGVTIEENYSPGKYLEDEFGVPLYNTPIPIGLENTDVFLSLLSQLTGKEVPEALKQERGRLLDCMIDSHKYNAQGTSAIFGEPELVFAATKMCCENGIKPAVVATGSKTAKLAELVKPLCGDASLLDEADFVSIRSISTEMKVNVAIGNSDGKYLTEKEGIPLVRFGFPIHDRIGGQRLLSVGYIGTTMFLDRVTNTLLENKYNNYRKEMYQKFYWEPKKKTLAVPGS